MSDYHPTYTRLARVMSFRNRAPAQLREALGITKQAFGHWKNRGVPAGRLLEIAKILRCNPEWLRTGRGSMLDVNGIPPHNATQGLLNEDAVFIARVYMIAGAEMRRAWRLIAEDYLSRLSDAERRELTEAIEDDLARLSRRRPKPPTADSA